MEGQPNSSSGLHSDGKGQSRPSRLPSHLAVGLETNSANWLRIGGLVRMKIATIDWVDDMWDG